MITHPFVSGGIKEDIWEITVNTEATTSGAKTTGIPINLYSQPGITMKVDWGDGTESVLTSASYSSASDSAPSVHEYATAGTYIVQMKSTKWKDAYIEVLGHTYTGVLSHIAGFRSTLVEVGQLPRCKGVLYRASSTSSPFRDIHRFRYCFYGCSNLTSIPAGLFDNNPAVMDFNSCFQGCSNLTSIPNGLFDNNPDVTSFNCCFWRCSKLQSIPSGLFHNNSKVTDFHMTFFACNLSDIPVDIFINCTAVTDMSGTFGNNPITSVPSGLFSSQTLVTTLGNNTNTSNGIFSAGSRGVIAIDENLFAHMLNLTQARFAFQGHYGFSIRFRATELTDITAFCDKNTEHPVTVYVPAGSATAKAFHDIAGATGITVVEE